MADVARLTAHSSQLTWVQTTNQPTKPTKPTSNQLLAAPLRSRPAATPPLPLHTTRIRRVLTLMTRAMLPRLPRTCVCISRSLASGLGGTLQLSVSPSRSRIGRCYVARSIRGFNTSTTVRPAAANMASESKVHLSAAQKPAFYLPGISDEAARRASELVQGNHERYHVFFNKAGFHVCLFGSNYVFCLCLCRVALFVYLSIYLPVKPHDTNPRIRTT